jgi:hypothetical protein
LTPLEHFPVVTPLGPATCIGVLDQLDDVEWPCWVNATQEMFFFRNPEIRRRPNITNNFTTISPFMKIGAPLKRQIDRYKAAGWLPRDYDPMKVETWRF